MSQVSPKIESSVRSCGSDNLSEGFFNYLTQLRIICKHTPNANMADRSVVARNESHGNEASEASTGKSYFVVDLVFFISLCLRVAVSLNVTRRDTNLLPFTS